MFFRIILRDTENFSMKMFRFSDLSLQFFRLFRCFAMYEIYQYIHNYDIYAIM